MATQSSLYETIETLISVVQDTDVLDVVGKLVKTGTQENVTAKGDGAIPEGEKPKEDTASKIADILEKIINFNFDKAVEASTVNGVTTAVLNLDDIAAQFGITSEPLGTVEIKINHKYHSMRTSGKAMVENSQGVGELKEWISLSSEKAAARDYSKFDKGQYVSIEFLPTLIQDLISFATDDNGNLHDTFTLSGSISANLVGMLDIEIDNCTVTAKIGESGIKLSVVMHVNKSKVLGMGVPESTVGITFANGLLTLAKGLNTSTPQYKVMTFDYFLDHLLTKNDSALSWLLDISGWDLVMSFVKVDVNSGLTSPEDISLFDKTETQEDKEISMYDFVNALRVIINGKATAQFGDYSSLESDLGIDDNYYGFALNAPLITDGVLTKLNAAITRSANGVENVIASGAIQSYVTFSANLSYKENWTEEYALGSPLQGEKTAPDLYAKALAVAAECNYVPNFDYFERKPDQGYDEKFGCVSVSYDGSGYGVSTDYSKILYSHKLTIVSGDKTEERLVRHGSTVHLYDNSSPVYKDETKQIRLIYSTSSESIGAAEIIMNGDTTVYAVERRAVNVIFENNGNELVVYSFEGDFVPNSVQGLDTIEGPFYEDGTQVCADDKISSGISVLRLHGVFVKSEVIVNYVKYTFDATAKSYIASGKAAGFNDYYSVQGNTLVLENEVGGYPVTAIAEMAFANADGKPVRNVVVPENIVKVGKKAFLGNTDMQSVTFLANEVTLEGSKNKNEKSYPFYGCSLSSDDEKTALKVYYNQINGGNLDWTNFRIVETSPGIVYYMYIGNDPNTSEWINYNKNGGGELHRGDWVYNVLSVNDKFNLEEVKSVVSSLSVGVQTEEIETFNAQKAAEVKTLLTQALSGYVSEYGEKYVVTADFDLVNGCNAITVNINENVPASVKVVSEIPFSYAYGDQQITAIGCEQALNAVKSESNVVLDIPVAIANDGYYYCFLGWAVMTDGNLKMIENVTAYSESTVYYPVWGASKNEIRACSQSADGSLPTPQGRSGAFYKWYNDGSFTEEATSVTQTVIYARWQYALTVKVSLSTSKLIYDVMLDGSEISGKSGEKSVKVLEGEVLLIDDRSNNQKDYFVKYDGTDVDIVGKINVRVRNKSQVINVSCSSALSGNKVVVSGDLVMNFTVSA